MPVLKRIIASFFILPAVLLIGSCGGSDEPVSTAPPVENPIVPDGLALAPIEGLTTQWHVLVPGPKEGGDGIDGIADASSSPRDGIRLPIPRGTTVKLSCSHAEDGRVEWTGATEVENTMRRSVATCALETAGSMEVRALVSDEGSLHKYRVTFEVVDVRLEDIRVRLSPRVHSAVEVTENATNQETMIAYFGESIAELKKIAPRSYRTSVGRNIDFGLQVDPPELAPVMEWRIQGEVSFLSRKLTRSFPRSGRYRVSVGPPHVAAEVEIETYAIRIVSHESNVEIVPEGIPITFSAVTEPPGYEDEIRWISSTKYGTASPITGSGRDFTVTFRSTWGRAEIGQVQWLGVKADNVVFNQDQKSPPVPTVSSFSPSSGGPGTIITVNGSGFGTNPDHICIALESSGRLIGLEIQSMNDNTLAARVPYVPPAVVGVAQNLHVIRAIGARTTITPEPDIILPPNQWIWAYDGEPEVTAPGMFTPTSSSAPGLDPKSPAVVTKNFYSGGPVNGRIELLIDEDWAIGQTFLVSARVHRAGTGADTNFQGVEFTASGTRLTCAVRLCNMLEDQFASHPTRPLAVACSTFVQNNDALIRLSLPGETIEAGNLDIILQ